MKAHVPWLVALALAACSSADPIARSTPSATTTQTSAPLVAATASPSAEATRAPDPCAPLRARPEKVADAPGATTFTTDGTDLFWSDGHAIYERPVAGGDPKRIVNDAVSVAEVNQLEVDGDQLWIAAAANGSGSSCLGLVGFFGRDGGTVQKVGPAGCAEAFALSKDKVAITQQSTASDGSIAGNVFAAPRTKGGKTTVLKRGINGSGGVATDGTYAYFPGEIGWMHRILLIDGPTEVVSKERTGIESISGTRFAVDDTDVYVYFGHLNLRGLGIMKLPKAGGPGVLLAEALPKTPRGEDYPKAALRLTDTHVIWSHPGSGVIKRIAKKEKCAPETIATDQPGADWITITETHFYWLNTASAPPQVMRLAR